MTLKARGAWAINRSPGGLSRGSQNLFACSLPELACFVLPVHSHHSHHSTLNRILLICLSLTAQSFFSFYLVS